MAGGVEGELPVEVGVQGVMGGREELVRPLLGWSVRGVGCWGGCAGQVVGFFFVLFFSLFF